MEIEFDPAKDAVNKRKRGISLALAREVDWNEAQYEVDNRYDYGEIRMRATVPLKGSNQLYVVVFTERGGITRIISLRKAEKHEVDKYVRNFY